MDSWYKGPLSRDLTAFIGKTLVSVDPAAIYLPNWHICLIAEYLEAARRAEITRLIINLPPRALKSVSVSVAWPAWLLGHDPRSRVIAASYAAKLSLKHSLDCRMVIASPWYRELFPELYLAHDQNEKHKFMTTARGFRLATSVGGVLTGEGGNFLIIDDPINPLQGANTLMREAANRWFDHTLASRLDDKKRGVIVLVMQRLHPNDLTGHLLAKGGWEHLVIPAVAAHHTVYEFGRVYKERKAGELLHHQREDSGLVARAKTELGSSAFCAQYQQAPVAEEGALVRRAWIGRYRMAPALFERIVQSWDTGIKAGAHNDPTACLTFGESAGKSYLLSVMLERFEYPDLKRAFYDSVKRHQPGAILLEDKASGQQLLQDAKRETHLPIIAIKPKHDKLTRFAAVAAMIEAGRLVLPEEAPWLAEFEQELFAFPNAAHDDQVDALSQYLDWLRKNGSEKLGIRTI